MSDFPDISAIVESALAEDIGAGDITSQLTIPENAQASMAFVAGEDLVVCGGFVPAAVYAHLDPAIRVEVRAREGQGLKAGDVIAIATGNARVLLAGERVALNLMQRMSGVATLTRKYVDAVAGTKAKILDTRKTMPGLRALDKYAVKTGGGVNHRMRLDDAVLVKDNHLIIGVRGSGHGVREVIEQIKTTLSTRYPLPVTQYPIIIECDTLSQLDEALSSAPDRILLDNMDLPTLREAVRRAAGRIPLEASGGVSLETVRAIAETGVDYISVGKLTHSAPAVDIGAEIEVE